MDENKTCTAVFNSLSPPTGPGFRDSYFIATAAYGSEMAGELTVPRSFRGRYLLTNAAGRAFVRLYYAHSPVIADLNAQHEQLRTAIRMMLWPVVYAIVNPHSVIVVMVFLIGGLAMDRRVRRHMPDAGTR